MLKKEKLAELEALVRTKHPNFDSSLMPRTVSGIISIQTPEAFPFAGIMRSFVTGCGVLEMSGLYPLPKLTEIQQAILALWLHNARGPSAVTCIIASSSSNGHNHVQTDQEKILMHIGFTPVHRGHNGAHGGTNNNFVTLWVFELSEPTEIPGLTPPPPPPEPPKAPAVAVRKLKRRALSLVAAPKKAIRLLRKPKVVNGDF